MFKIHEAQARAFKRALVEQFEEKLCMHLCSAFPEQIGTLTAQEASDVVRVGIAKAQTYGIIGEYDIQRFAEYMIILGNDFDTEHVWARDILMNLSASGGSKVDEIEEYYLFKVLAHHA